MIEALRPWKRAGPRPAALALWLLAAIGCTDLEPGVSAVDPPDFRPEPAPSRVVVTPSSDTLFGLGETVSLAAVAVGPDDQVLQTATILWRSTNQAVATVEASTGWVTAVGYGSVDILAESGSAHGTAVILVTAETP